MPETVEELNDEQRAIMEASGTFLNCDCAWCRELRLRDPDRIFYSAHELVDAYIRGRDDGIERGMAYADTARESGDRPPR